MRNFGKVRLQLYCRCAHCLYVTVGAGTPYCGDNLMCVGEEERSCTHLSLRGGSGHSPQTLDMCENSRVWIPRYPVFSLLTGARTRKCLDTQWPGLVSIKHWKHAAWQHTVHSAQLSPDLLISTIHTVTKLLAWKLVSCHAWSLAVSVEIVFDIHIVCAFMSNQWNCE